MTVAQPSRGPRLLTVPGRPRACDGPAAQAGHSCKARAYRTNRANRAGVTVTCRGGGKLE